MTTARSPFPICPSGGATARRTICQPCTITYNRTTAQAFVRDVSPGGFGLERVPQLPPKSLVLVELPSGRRFTGVVVWCRRIVGRRALLQDAAAQ